MWRMVVLAFAAVIASGAIACGSGDGDSSKDAKLALTSADCQIAATSTTAGCHGMVKNLTADNISGLYVQITWVDDHGEVMFKSDGQPIYGVILSGAEVQWDAGSDYDPKAKDYRIDFLDAQGQPVSTVDQRPE